MAETTRSTEAQKVVVQFGERSIKGYLESPAWTTRDLTRLGSAQEAPETLRIRLVESGAVKDISIQNVKAVFFVRSFEGDPEHKVVNFYSRAPIPDGIWMRFEFRDGEVMEGIVLNSLDYLVNPGFFVLPTAPDSNNELVYVLKNWLSDHRVLGLRAAKFRSQAHNAVSARNRQRREHGNSTPGETPLRGH